MYDTAVDAMLKQMVNLKIKKMHISIKAKAIILNNEGRNLPISGKKDIKKTIISHFALEYVSSGYIHTKPNTCASNPN